MKSCFFDFIWTLEYPESSLVGKYDIYYIFFLFIHLQLIISWNWNTFTLHSFPFLMFWRYKIPHCRNKIKLQYRRIKGTLNAPNTYFPCLIQALSVTLLEQFQNLGTRRKKIMNQRQNWYPEHTYMTFYSLEWFKFCNQAWRS